MTPPHLKRAQVAGFTRRFRLNDSLAASVLAVACGFCAPLFLGLCVAAVLAGVSAATAPVRDALPLLAPLTTTATYPLLAYCMMAVWAVGLGWAFAAQRFGDGSQVRHNAS